MVCQGVVRNGRIELEPSIRLPEGTRVNVEILDRDWVEDWAKFARRVADASKDSRSALDVLAETRR